MSLFSETASPAFVPFVCLVYYVNYVYDEDTSDVNSLASAIVIPTAVFCPILAFGKKSAGRSATVELMASIVDEP